MTNTRKNNSNLNVPNGLTSIRIFLIPIFIVLYYLPIAYHYELAALVFAIASLTDWLDGFIARKLKQETNFGAFFDPIADKLIVVIALMLLLGEYNSYWITVPVIFIVSREIIISGLREWMAGIGQSNVVAVAYIGKIKTTVQMLSIIILLSQEPAVSHGFSSFSSTVQFGIGLLLVAAMLSIWSMISYFNCAWPKLFKNN